MIRQVKFTPTERSAVQKRMEAYNALISTIAELRGLVGGRISVLPDGSGFSFDDMKEEGEGNGRTDGESAA